MGLIHNSDHSGGWNPSIDDINGSPNFYPRLDNMVLDDQGILTLRRGMVPVSGAAPLIGGGGVHSLFTITMDEIRYRYAGIDDSVFRSTSVGFYDEIISGLTGTGDTHFGSDLGQVFIARGHDRYKDDGNTVNQWGVEQIPTAPTLSAIPSDEKEFSSFNDGETPEWIATEGVVSSAVGFDDSPDGARGLTAGVTSGKGAMRRIFGAETDFTAYDGGDTGVDEDLIEFYLWASRPDSLEYVTVSFDVNGDSTAEGARFRDDYYYVQLTLDEAMEIKLDPTQALDERFDVEGYDRENFVFDLQGVGGGKTREGARIPRATPSATSNSGWARYSIPRGKFIRVGSSNNKNWSTVKAIQVEYKATLEKDTTGTPISSCDIRMDNLRIIGGRHHALTGKYKVIIQARAQHSKYQGKAPASPVSREIELRANGLRVRCDIPVGFDPQVTSIAAFIMGGTIDSFYFAKEVDVTGHNLDIDIDLSDRDILITDQRLDPSIQNPPIDVQDIAGPFDQRMFVLTSDAVNPSLGNDPDAFSANQVMPVPGKSTTAFWLRSVVAEPILGTSRDIYRIEGDGSVSPDGIINYRFVPMNVPPPISSFVAQEGNLLLYMAADGPRIFNGTTSLPIQGNNDLLYRGSARYGVEAINLGSQPGRFRGGIFNNELHMMTAEGLNNDVASPYLHVQRLGQPRWDRKVYPRSFQTVYREPDGKILAGGSNGDIYQLEATENIGDQVVGNPSIVPIPVTIWTVKHDGKAPLALKAAEDVRADVDVGGGTITVQAMLDTASPSWSFGASSLTGFSFLESLEAIETKRFQLRITGSVTGLKIRSWSFGFRDRPIGRAHWDSGYIDLGPQREFVWVRLIKGMALIRGPVYVKVYLDDTPLGDPESFTSSSYPKLSDFEIKYGRNIRGRQLRVTMTKSGSTSLEDEGFEPYWLEIYYRVSGKQSLEKKVIRIAK